MSLYEEINEHLKEALKSKKTDALNALRGLKAVIKNKEVELRRKLEDNEIIQLIAKQIKQRKESIAQFQKGNRPDLVEKEEKELKVLEQFMPPPLSEEALDKILQEIITETGAIGPQDMGKVMKVAMSRLSGQAEGKSNKPKSEAISHPI
ncbi:putative protein YqeY [Candidatus Methanoperedenaceae archaeon GB37]|nr:putative protein YqeY [Candidatus Methanoperedenaceae archaeon GB37]